MVEVVFSMVRLSGSPEMEIFRRILWRLAVLIFLSGGCGYGDGQIWWMSNSYLLASVIFGEYERSMIDVRMKYRAHFF